MWYTARVTLAYGTGAGYEGAEAHRNTTMTATAMCRSPRKAMREAYRLASRMEPQLADVVGSAVWYWMPTMEFFSLYRDGIRISYEVS